MPTDGVPETPEGRAARWRPVLALPCDAALARRLVLAAGPHDANDTVRLLSVVSGLAWWASETGLPIDADTLTDPRVTARYAATGMPGLSANWRRHALNSLDRLSTAHHGEAVRRPARPRAERVPGRPYTEGEVDALLRWADGQRSPIKRHTLLVALAGGLGAGLANADLRTVRGTDVDTGPDGETVVAAAGRAAREVTVLRRYETLLARLAADAGDGWLLRPGREPASRASACAPLQEVRAGKGVPALTTVRCRTTWLVRHLTAGTRLDVLAAAAGVSGARALLVDNLRWLPAQDPDLALRALRAAAHPLGPSFHRPAVAPPPPGPAGPAEEAEEALRAYQPRLADPRHAPLVRTVAAATGPQTAQAARNAATAVADLVAWADRHGHPTRTPDDVLRRDLVDAWTAAPDGAARWTPVTRRIRITTVEQAVRALCPDQYRPAVALNAPYGRADLDRLLAAGRALPDLADRQPFLAALALCVGTGVTAREATTVTGDRIRRDPTTGTVLVDVPGPRGTRTVPCLAEHEDLLLDAARHAGPAWVVAPGHADPNVEDLRRAVLVAVPASQAPTLTARRCRATWLRAQLSSGTRADTFLRAAGLTSPSKVSSWVELLDPPLPGPARALLRGT